MAQTSGLCMLDAGQFCGPIAKWADPMPSTLKGSIIINLSIPNVHEAKGHQIYQTGLVV